MSIIWSSEVTRRVNLLLEALLGPKKGGPYERLDIPSLENVRTYKYKCRTHVCRSDHPRIQTPDFRTQARHGGFKHNKVPLVSVVFN